MRSAAILVFLVMGVNNLFAAEFVADSSTVGLWHFNEGAGSVLNDSSGNGNTGTVTSGTWQPGIHDQAIYFDGIDDEISITNESNFDLGEFTLECWFNNEYSYTGVGNPSAYLISKGDNNNIASDRSYELDVHHDGRILGLIALGNIGESTFAEYYSKNSITAGWHYAALVVSSDTLSLYIDGVLDGKVGYTGTVRNSTHPIRIGSAGDMFGNNQFYKGYIDGVRISNTARGAVEIMSHWTENQDLANTVGYWNLDEGTGTAVVDSSVYKNNGIINGTGISWSPYGFSNSCLHFDGTGTTVDISNETDYDVTNLTIDFWFLNEYFGPSYTRMIAKGDGQDSFTDRAYEIGIYNRKLFASIFLGPVGTASAVTVYGASQIKSGWNYAALTVSDDSVRVFLNGAQVGVAYHADTLRNSGNPVTFGMTTGGHGIVYYKGFLDDIRISNIARGSEEILTRWNDNIVGDTCLAYWDFNSGTGDTLYDKSGFNNHGIISGAQWTDGISGKALLFDGINDSVTVPHSEILNTKSEFTVAAWFQHDFRETMDWSKSQVLLCKGKDQTPGYYGLSWDASSSGSYLYMNNFTNGTWSGDPVKAIGADAQIGTWHYLVGTQRDDSMFVYLDGELINAVATDTLQLGLNDQDIKIGKLFDYDYFWNGKIDEIKIFNYAITGEDIAAIWAGNREAASLIAYWDFNTGSGDTLYDQSIYKNHGIINGATWTNGIDGNALSFDGIDDNVDCGNDPSLNVTTNITIEAWVKPAISPDTSGGIVRKRNESISRYELFRTPSGDMGYKNCSRSIASNTLKAGIWSYAVGVYDGAVMKTYINGVFADSLPMLETFDLADEILEIGHTGSGGIGYFNGVIDEIKIWSIAITESAITANWAGHQNTATLLTHCDFNEGIGNTVFDRSEYGNDGLINGATWTSGIDSSALEFDGTDDFVSFGDNFDPDDKDLSISFWLSTTQTSRFDFDKRVSSASADNYGIIISFNVSAEDQHHFRIGDEILDWSYDINDGNWHLVTLVRDTYQSKLCVYVNGVMVDTAGVTIGDIQNDASFNIGKRYDNQLFLAGKVDEFSIQRRVLSSVEIAALTNVLFIISTPETTVFEDSLYTYDIAVYDTAIGGLHYSLTTAPSGMIIDSITGAVSWIPGNSDVGSHQVVIEADGGTGRTDSQTYLLTVVNTNDVPEITSPAVTQVFEDSLYSYVVTANDSDANDTITYALTLAPDSMVIDPVTGIIAWTPQNSDVGAESVSVQASDGNGGIATQIFVLTIINTNDVPVMISSAVTSALEDSLYKYTVSATDEDTGDTVLIYSLIQAPDFMDIDSLTGQITCQPVNEDVGVESVTVQAADANGGTVLQSFVLTIANTNDVPVISSSPVDTAYEDMAYTYAVMAGDVDVGDSLTYALTLSPDSMVIDPVTGIISWIPQNSDAGIESIMVQVTDGSMAEDVQEYMLTVVEINDAPQFTSAPNLTAIEDIMYSYMAVAVDEEDDGITYSLILGPDSMTIDSVTGIILWTPLNADVGAESLIVMAVDDRGGETEQEYVIAIVNTNDAPVITSVPLLHASEDTLYTYNVVADEVDAGDEVVYELVAGPDSMVIHDSTGVISWTPGAADVGTVTVKVKAIDNSAAVDSQEFALVVLHTNHAPSIPGLISPADGTQLKRDGALAWTMSADVDDSDSIYYRLQICADTSGGTPEVEEAGLTAIAVYLGDLGQINNLQNLTVYYWRVGAEDNQGGTSGFSAYRNMLYMDYPVGIRGMGDLPGNLPRMSKGEYINIYGTGNNNVSTGIYLLKTADGYRKVLVVE